MNRPLRVLSLGAGVQSTTVALMSVKGDLPKLDHAIFADTGWEPKAVYRHLGWLTGVMERAGIPISVVSAGNIRENFATGRKDDGANGHAAMYAPVHVRKPDGLQGMAPRQCTTKYKITPIRKEVARLIGKPPGARWPTVPRVELWLGISLDEVERMRLSDRPAIVHRFPLVDDARMTRGDCLLYLAKNGFPTAPKSACVGCPYRSDDQWRDLRDNDPESFADAIDVDERLRSARVGRAGYTPFLHRSLRPLRDVDFDDVEDRGQGNLLDGIAAGECGGLCGT